MFRSSSSGSSSGPVPEPEPIAWEPPVGGEIAHSCIPLLMAMFGLRTCWYESFPFDRQLPRIEPTGIMLADEEPGISSWSLDMGVELPVRYGGLTLGRFVLVPAWPTTGIHFSPTSRADAIGMVVSVGAAIAATMIADDSDVTGMCQ